MNASENRSVQSPTANSKRPPAMPRNAEKPARYVPKPGNTEQNTDYRRRAHARLDELLDLAENSRMHGEVGVVARLEVGRIIFVRRHFQGTDK